METIPRKNKILMIGSNPANKAPNNEAFHKDVMSRQRLTKLVGDLSRDYDVGYLNVYPFKTEDNRPPKMSEIHNFIPILKRKIRDFEPDKVVAVGMLAFRVLTSKIKLQDEGYFVFYLPHPSGLNRFWNDKEKSEEMVQKLKRFLSET